MHKLYILLLFMLLASCAPRKIETQILVSALLQDINQLRTGKNLAPLQISNELTTISQDQISKPEYRDVLGGLHLKQLPPFNQRGNLTSKIVEGNATQFLMNYSIGRKTEIQLAKEFFNEWRLTPEYYKTLVEPETNFTGIAVLQHHERLYLSQIFSVHLAKLISPLPSEVPEGRTLSLSFQYLANFPPAELVVNLLLPFNQQQVQTSPHQDRGLRKLWLRWQDDHHFEILVPTVAGPGIYQLAFGREDYVARSSLNFRVVAGK